jgi:hypothetical protein
VNLKRVVVTKGREEGGSFEIVPRELGVLLEWIDFENVCLNELLWRRRGGLKIE